MFRFRALLSLVLFLCVTQTANASENNLPSRSCSSYGSCELLYWTYQHQGYDFALKTKEWKRSPTAFLKEYPEGTSYSAKAPYCPGVRLRDIAALFHLPLFFEVGITYVPFKDSRTIKAKANDTPLAALTHPATFTGGFPASEIHSSRSLRYLLADYIARLDGCYAGPFQLGVYAGGRALVLMQKWKLTHLHTHQKGTSRVEWNMKMGTLGGTGGFLIGYQVSDFCLNLRAGGSLLKGVRGGSQLAWNFKTELSKENQPAKYTPCNRWIGGFDACIQAEYACLSCFPCLRVTLGYDLQQWFGIPQRDRYEFVSWHCHQKRSNLTVQGVSLGCNFCF